VNRVKEKFSRNCLQVSRRTADAFPVKYPEKEGKKSSVGEWENA